MKWRPILIAGLVCVAVAGAVIWLQHVQFFGHWLMVHTGTVNEPGPYYGFWSGFGSDLEEFGILGAIGAGVYQLVKKYNCHEPGCWRLGNHPAAGGQFSLCYRHHPDFQGKKPTHELIERLHREHLERQEAIHSKLSEVHQHLIAGQATADDRHSPGTHTAPPGAHTAPAGGTAGPGRAGQRGGAPGQVTSPSSGGMIVISCGRSPQPRPTHEGHP